MEREDGIAVQRESQAEMALGGCDTKKEMRRGRRRGQVGETVGEIKQKSGWEVPRAYPTEVPPQQ